MSVDLNDPTTPRWHNTHVSLFMVEKDGWCLIRKEGDPPDYYPYVFSLKSWLALPDAETGRQLHEDFMAARSKFP